MYLCQAHGHLWLCAFYVKQHIQPIKQPLLDHFIPSCHHSQQIERLLKDDANAFVLFLERINDVTMLFQRVMYCMLLRPCNEIPPLKEPCELMLYR